MIFTLALAALVGGFFLLYPLAKRMATLMDVKAQREAGPRSLPAEDVKLLSERVEALESELGRLRERQDFTEGLVARREPESLPKGSVQR